MIASTLKRLNRFEEVTSSVALSLMAGIIILQVFQRYVMQHSLDWPEELARYLFIYSVYVGSSYAAAGRRHLEVTIIRTVFGKKIGIISTVIAYIISVFFCGLMFIWGIKMIFFVIESGQVAPALQFPMWIAYLCIPVGFILMAFRTCLVIIKYIKNYETS